MTLSMIRSLFRSQKKSLSHRSVNQKRHHLRRAFLESLEDRRVMVAQVYVNDTWIETTDNGGTPGVVEVGDIVESNTGAGDASISGLTFGTDAFATIQDGINNVDVSGTVSVLTGTYLEDVLVNKTEVHLLGAGPGSSIVSGVPGGDNATIRVAANSVEVAGFTITREGNNVTDWNDPTLNSAGVAAQGSLLGMNLHDNLITGNRTGIDINNSSGHWLHNNVITNNHTGLIFRNQTDNLLVEENSITENRTVGIVFLDASGGSNSPVQTALGSTFFNNDISGNWYGQIVDRQVGGSLPAPGTTNLKNFSNNWFGTTDPVITTANSAEPGYAALIPVAFGGTATAPGGQPDIAGPASDNFDITPYLNSGADTDVETTVGRGTYGFQGSFDSLTVTSTGAQTGTTPRIQEGVNSANSDGDVYVTAGTFVESVTVNKPLNLFGNQAGVDARTRSAPMVDETIVQGPGAVGTRRSPFEVAPAAAGTTIDGFTLENGDNPNFAPAAIWLQAGTNGNTVRNNIIQNNTAGLFVANNSATEQTVIEYNRFSDNTLAGPSSGSDIYADNFTAGEGMQNVLVQNNLFTNSAPTTDTWAFGMSNVSSTTTFTNITVTNNEINNHGRGMYFYGTSASEVSNNIVTGAERYALGFFAINGVVSNSDFVVTGNTFDGGAKGVYLIDDTVDLAYLGTLTLTDNDFTVPVAGYSIVNDSVTPIDATMNTFDGIDASTASTAQQFAIVDKIIDALDAAGAGYVTTKAGEVFVTPNSFTDPVVVYNFAATTTADLQRAVDAANSIFTSASVLVHIQTGAYAGALSTGTSTLTLIPEVGPVQLTQAGDLELGENTTVKLQLTGTDPLTQYDNFVVNGGVSLGNAMLDLKVNFIPIDGDTFTLIDNDDVDAVVGVFSDDQGSPLPEGASVTANGKTFTISYVGGDGNDVVLTFANNAPTIVQPFSNVFVNVGAPNQMMNVSSHFTDVEDATLTYSAATTEGDVVQVTINGDKLILNFANNAGGIANVTVTATDSSGASVSDTFKVTVNDAPVASPALPDITVNAGTPDRTINLRNYFSDDLDAHLTYSATSTDDSVVKVTISGEKLILSFANNNSGMANVVVTATDSNGLSVTERFKVTVNLLPTVTVRNNQLRIVGTQSKDVIVVNKLSGTFYVFAYIGDTRFRVYSTKAISTIFVTGKGSDDEITIGNFVTEPTKLLGGGGNDIITGGLGPDVIFGGGGNDVLTGRDGDDVMIGGSGNDVMDGGDGNDVLAGNNGHDLLFGGDGDDILIGGKGEDDLTEVSGIDYLIGGSVANETNARALMAAMNDWILGKKGKTMKDLGDYQDDGANDTFAGNLTGDKTQP